MVSPYLKRPLRSLDEMLAREGKSDAATALGAAKLRRAELGTRRDSRVESDGIDAARRDQIAVSNR